MKATEKTALRAARLIRQQLFQRWQAPSRAAFPDEFWHNIERLMRQIDIARYRGWHAAARQRTEDLGHEVEYCRQRLGDFSRQLQHVIPKKIPSESEIFEEIMAVHDEFSEVEIDLQSGEICITTEPIVLDDTHLGPFQVRLDWNRLGSHQPYRIVALDPHPAAANKAVTHPHVQEERLCEGEGRAGIESALNTGRLLDFFLIVSRLLGTYARGSAFIELAAWEGIRCQDCGSMTYEDDRYHCDRCGSDLCDECCLSCQGCERGLCSDCMGTCARCGDRYCSTCLTACNTCHEDCCQNCLEEGLCENCHEQPDDDDEPAAGAESPADAPADAADCRQWLDELLENTCRGVPTAGAGAAV
jgi:hypothetical protein